jgi:hypothetical protein
MIEVVSERIYNIFEFIDLKGRKKSERTEHIEEKGPRALVYYLL